MKLIIDIDEAIYKEIKEEVKAKANTSSHIPFLHEVISVGKPLNKRLTGKWIPVSERLPEDETEVLIQFQYGQSMAVGYHIFDHIIYPSGFEDENKTGWYDSEDNFICGSDEVIAWMPLPEPYKEEEK